MLTTDAFPPLAGVARQAFPAALLHWYDAHRRDLPWRAKPGLTADPYRVWLSEIMLQQTTVKAVIPYFRAFLDRWPTLDALARAPLDDVLAAWAGLGYYARARNLHACAKAVAALGGFPRTEAELRKLPGVGAYTAAAIAAIAYDEPATAVDGNVERVVARLFAVEEPLPRAKPKLKALAATLTPQSRPGDYTQAMMDLGATICSPKSPSCLICPVSRFCKAHALGVAALLPRKSVKAERPLRYGAAFVALRGEGGRTALLLRTRPDKGLLARMAEVPGTPWLDAADGPCDGFAAPFPAEWRRVPGRVAHTFTHFHLELVVFAARTGADEGEGIEGARWVRLDDLPGEALPGVMRKVIAHGLEALGQAPMPPRQAGGTAASSASSVSTVERSARPSTRAGRK